MTILDYIQVPHVLSVQCWRSHMRAECNNASALKLSNSITTTYPTGYVYAISRQTCAAACVPDFWRYLDVAERLANKLVPGPQLASLVPWHQGFLTWSAPAAAYGKRLRKPVLILLQSARMHIGRMSFSSTKLCGRSKHRKVSGMRFVMPDHCGLPSPPGVTLVALWSILCAAA